MACSCCQPTGAIGRFFSRFAKMSAKHYRKKGLAVSQKQLLSGIDDLGFEQATILEIGCGVGYLHQSLLNSGAKQALGIDISDKMITEAKTMAIQTGLEGRTDYRVGDFIDLAEKIDGYDLCILDKVVCCYPDAENLIKLATAKTRRVLALTFPRKNIANMIGIKLMWLVLFLIRSPFRNYLHDPDMIEHDIIKKGFEKKYQNQTWLWTTQVYQLC